MIGVYCKVDNVEALVKMPWKVGIVAFMAFPSTLKNEGVIEATETLLKDGFFDVIEYHVMPKEVLKKVAEMTEEYGVELAGALQPVILVEKFNINSLNEDERAKAVKRLKEQVDVAHSVGIKKVALCSGPDPGPRDREQAMKALHKSLLELCDHAKSYGITVYLENFDREYDKKLLLGPTLEAYELIKGLRGEVTNLMLLWDLSHAPLLHEKPQVLKEVKDVLGHIHIGCTEKTSEGLKDYHPGFYTPNAINDVNDVAELLKVLLDIGYEGGVSFEVKPKSQETSLQIINAAKGVLYTAFQKTIKECLEK